MLEEAAAARRPTRPSKLDTWTISRREWNNESNWKPNNLRGDGKSKRKFQVFLEIMSVSHLYSPFLCLFVGKIGNKCLVMGEMHASGQWRTRNYNINLPTKKPSKLLCWINLSLIVVQLKYLWTLYTFDINKHQWHLHVQCRFTAKHVNTSKYSHNTIDAIQLYVAPKMQYTQYI